jgi:hypothetical protein
MAQTLMQLRRLVRSRLGVPLDDDFMQDNVLDDHINLALQTIDGEAHWPWSAGVQVVELTPINADFAAPDDWRSSRAVFYGERELGLVAPADLLRHYGSSDVPAVWCPMGAVVSVRPLPNVPIVVSHYYYRQSKWLYGDGDVPALPAAYTGAVVAKASELLAARESSGGDATRHGAEYTEWMTRMRRDMRRSTSGVHVRVRPGGWV